MYMCGNNIVEVSCNMPRSSNIIPVTEIQKYWLQRNKTAKVLQNFRLFPWGMFGTPYWTTPHKTTD